MSIVDVGFDPRCHYSWLVPKWSGSFCLGGGDSGEAQHGHLEVGLSRSSLGGYLHVSKSRILRLWILLFSGINRKVRL